MDQSNMENGRVVEVLRIVVVVAARGRGEATLEWWAVLGLTQARSTTSS